MRFATSLSPVRALVLSAAACFFFAAPAHALDREEADVCNKVPEFCNEAGGGDGAGGASGGGGEASGGDYGGDAVDDSHVDPSAPNIPDPNAPRTDPNSQPRCVDLKKTLAQVDTQLAAARAQLTALQTSHANAVATATANVNSATAAYNAALARVNQLAAQLAPYKEPPEINPHTGKPYGVAHPATYDTSTAQAKALFASYQQALHDLAVAMANLTGAKAGLAAAQSTAPSSASIATLTAQVAGLQKQAAHLQSEKCRAARSKMGLQSFRAHLKKPLR